MKNKTKNKTQSNEKLARNTIRARKALKKRTNEQTTQTRRKRWQSRLFALVGCLLLVSALVVPCFADYEQPTQKIIDDPLIDVRYLVDGYNTEVDLSGYYEIRFDSLGSGEISKTVLFRSNKLLDIIAYSPSTGSYRVVKELRVEFVDDARLLRASFFNTPNFNGVTTAVPVSDNIFYVRQYPYLAQNETIWSQFDYSVYQILESFEVDKATTIWTSIMTWITNALASIQSIFYANGSLTFLGTLAVIGVSIALAWLIIGIVTRFIQLRG